MTNVPTLDLQQKQLTSQQQLQRLMMLPGMQQAIHLLQMNALELAPLVETHLAQNPVIELNQDEEENEDIERLEEENAEEEEDIQDDPTEEMHFDEHDFDIIKRLDQDFRDNWIEENPYRSKNSADEQQQNFIEQSISVKPTLYEFLVTQAHDAFENLNDFAIAEILLGYLDESGYVQTPLNEIAALHEIDEKKLHEVLEVIQTFEPNGVGATNLQESLLIQLRCKNKQNSLASTIVKKHYDDLLHNRILQIEKSLHCPKEKIAKALYHDIARLDLRPGTTYSLQDPQPIVPDVSIKQDGEELLVGINDDFLPPMRINGRYLKLMRENNLTDETKQFIQQHISSAKWLLRNIQQRNNTLQRIVQVLAKKQKQFFLEPDGKLVPTTMKMVAEEIEMHESTVARAVANKYVDSPRGLLPLRSFFSNAYTTDEGVEISSKTVRDLVQELISKEDRRHPLSDASLATSLKEQGIACARRTVAKYRSELNLGNTQQRRQY